VRLHRDGKRQLNSAFNRIAITQIRDYPPAKNCIPRKLAGGKTKREATRFLKRQLVRTVTRRRRANSATSELRPVGPLAPGDRLIGAQALVYRSSAQRLAAGNARVAVTC
jgi:hypothetical protein